MAESAGGTAALVSGDVEGARTRFAQAATLYASVGHTFWAERSAQRSIQAAALIGAD